MGVGTRNAAVAKKAAPAKKVVPPAKKAAPVAKTAARRAAPKEEEPDLLADLNDETAAAVEDPEEVADMLDGLNEDAGTPWIPDDEDDPSPEGIQGVVTYIGTVSSDYGPEECPLIELEAADGTVWSIRGYSTVLRNQITKANPAVGDTLAVKYFGVKPNKAGTEYKNFKVAVRRAA